MPFLKYTKLAKILPQTLELCLILLLILLIYLLSFRNLDLYLAKLKMNGCDFEMDYHYFC